MSEEHLLRSARSNFEQSIKLYSISTQEIIRHSENKDRIINKLEKQNKRYREALQKIANKREVDFGNSYANKSYNHSIKLATETLESESNQSP